MKYESELKSQQVEVQITHLSKQIEALSSSLQEKELAAAQLQSELQTYKEVASTPEQLLGSLTLTTQIAELKHKLQEAEYKKQRAELEKEAALKEVKAKQNFEVQLHAQLGKC